MLFRKAVRPLQIFLYERFIDIKQPGIDRIDIFHEAKHRLHGMIFAADEVEI